MLNGALCVHMKPAWDSMKHDLLTRSSDKYDIEEIEHSEQEQGLNNLQQKYLINRNDIPIMGYPTLGGIREGRVYNYGGGRDEHSLKNFADKLYNGLVE